MDRGAWQATVQRVAESDITEGLSTHARMHAHISSVQSLSRVRLFVTP